MSIAISSARLGGGPSCGGDLEGSASSLLLRRCCPPNSPALRRRLSPTSAAADSSRAEIPESLITEPIYLVRSLRRELVALLFPALSGSPRSPSALNKYIYIASQSSKFQRPGLIRALNSPAPNPPEWPGLIRALARHNLAIWPSKKVGRRT